MNNYLNPCEKSQADRTRREDLTPAEVTAYLSRLHLPNAPELNADYLGKLIAAHKDRIPYENLDTFLLKRPASLQIPHIFQKAILEGRGGYCFELNLLFAALLRALGYAAELCLCKTRAFSFPVRHCGILVSLNHQAYFCDVGLGRAEPSVPIPLQDGMERQLDGYQCSTTQLDQYWWKLCYTPHGTELYICVLPVSSVDFEPFNYYMTMLPGKFRDQLVLNRTTPDGYIALVDRELTEMRAGEKAVTQLTAETLQGRIRTYFGIAVPDTAIKALWPENVEDS